MGERVHEGVRLEPPVADLVHRDRRRPDHVGAAGVVISGDADPQVDAEWFGHGAQPSAWQLAQDSAAAAPDRLVFRKTEQGWAELAVA